MLKRQHLLLLLPIGFMLVLLLLRLNSPPRPNHVAEGNAPVESSAKPQVAPSAEFFHDDFAQHVEQLRKRLPSNDFSIVIQPPFVVIGDEPTEAVKKHAETTIRWAVEKLKQDFFAKDPKETLDIWLFKDSASYKRNALALFGETPSTPYGYYSPTHKSLIMNISTGSGTLVHEIVHPFVEANFPACPSWLNEGLGSLFEQCGEEQGHIHGYTNWRLPGLQKAIRAKDVPTFRTLMSMDQRTFYDETKATNYAQSRYLLFYLQQRNLLRTFYREFYTHRKRDPTGYATLKRILRIKDMNAFQRKWENYVLGLSQDVVLTPLPSGSTP